MTIPTYKSGILQVKAYRILQARVSKTLGTFQLNPTEWSILGLIFENNNGIRHSELAKMLQVETPLITMLVNGLVEKELVERHNHPTDKRAKLLFVTQKSKTLIPQVEKVLSETLLQLLNGLTQKDMTIYKKVLEVIVTNASLVKETI